MKHFVVKYSLAYDHVVAVGIRANTTEEAEDTAQQLFDAGEIWDDTPDVPLLYDDFEEQEDNILQFEATEVDAWPQPDASVLKQRAERGAAVSSANLATFQIIGESNAKAVAAVLVDLSRWFAITPLPNDVFEIVVKNEALHQMPPEAVRVSGSGL